jgi:hypothetical protein
MHNHDSLSALLFLLRQYPHPRRRRRRQLYKLGSNILVRVDEDDSLHFGSSFFVSFTRAIKCSKAVKVELRRAGGTLVTELALSSKNIPEAIFMLKSKSKSKKKSVKSVVFVQKIQKSVEK